MIEKLWLSQAISIGVSYNEFWSLTPKAVLQILEGYNMAQKRKMEYDNLISYIQGRYFVDALACTVGNMFSKKGAKAHEYPKEPYNFEGEKELTQEEKDIKAKAIIDNLMLMKENFERNKASNNS